MKLHRWLSLILLPLGAAFLAACGRANAGGDRAAAGEAYFKAYGCEKCHAMGDEGGSYGPNLAFIGVRKSPQWLDLWLKNPHAWRKQTVMPNFHLPDDIRGDIVAYLATQKGQAWDKSGRPWNRPDVMGDSVKRGEILFNKAGCVACHSEKGRGGYPNNNVVGGLIPTLTHVSDGYTKDELIKKIRGGVNPAPSDPSQPAPLVFMPKWGEVLKDEEISAVADYLISLGAAPGGKPKKDDF